MPGRGVTSTTTVLSAPQEPSDTTLHFAVDNVPAAAVVPNETVAQARGDAGGTGPVDDVDRSGAGVGAGAGAGAGTSAGTGAATKAAGGADAAATASSWAASSATVTLSPHGMKWLDPGDILRQGVEKFMRDKDPVLHEAGPARVQEFWNRRVCSLVMSSLSLEVGTKTLNKGATGKVAYAIVQDEAGGVEKLAAKMAATFDAEGDTNDEGTCKGEWNKQVAQHTLAALKLFRAAREGTLLTMELVCDVHRVLFSGALDHSAKGSAPKPLPGGELRNVASCAGDYDFMPADGVGTSLQQLLEQFEAKVRDAKTHAVENAASLMLRFVTIHPFVNGNGRMCRLLFAYALLRQGFPFPVAITCPSKPRKRYIEALKRAQQSFHANRTDHLVALAMHSVVACGANFLQYATHRLD